MPSLVEGEGLASDALGGVAEMAIMKGIPFLAKKGVEMGRFFALRNKKFQQRAINYGLSKAQRAISKVGSELLDQLSIVVRPDKRYKTDRPDLDGAGFDIHDAIAKLPHPKKGWTLPGHNYTCPMNPLHKQLDFDPEASDILNIYQQPTGATDAATMQHDVDYSVCDNRKKKYNENLTAGKHKADRKLVATLDFIPKNKRQRGHSTARNIILLKKNSA